MILFILDRIQASYLSRGVSYIIYLSVIQSGVEKQVDVLLGGLMRYFLLPIKLGGVGRAGLRAVCKILTLNS